MKTFTQNHSSRDMPLVWCAFSIEHLKANSTRKEIPIITQWEVKRLTVCCLSVVVCVCVCMCVTLYSGMRLVCGNFIIICCCCSVHFGKGRKFFTPHSQFNHWHFDHIIVICEGIFARWESVRQKNKPEQTASHTMRGQQKEDMNSLYQSWCLPRRFLCLLCEKRKNAFIRYSNFKMKMPFCIAHTKSTTNVFGQRCAKC